MVPLMACFWTGVDNFATFIALNKPLDIPPSPLQEIFPERFESLGIRLWIKRDDLLHPVVSGNKWRKLCYNLTAAKSQGKKKLLTFGGAYSNHIHAVAAAGHLLNFQTTGLIRGEEPSDYGATLAFAKSHGMSLRFLDRAAYRNKEIPSNISLDTTYLLPEGGTNSLAIDGCGDIVKELLGELPPDRPTYICVPFGTGGTITGIINALDGNHQVLGFSALKGSFMTTEIESLQTKYKLTSQTNWSVNNDYHFGGYARYRIELIDFMKKFYSETDIPLDPIYTGKMVFGIFDLLKKNHFSKGSNVIIIHTGGLQGIIGFNERFGLNLPGGQL